MFRCVLCPRLSRVKLPACFFVSSGIVLFVAIDRPVPSSYRFHHIHFRFQPARDISRRSRAGILLSGLPIDHCVFSLRRFLRPSSHQRQLFVFSSRYKSGRYISTGLTTVLFALPEHCVSSPRRVLQVSNLPQRSQAGFYCSVYVVDYCVLFSRTIPSRLSLTLDPIH